MNSVIFNPIPKPALSYICQGCGHKLGLLSGIVKKKCPCCNGTKLKLDAGLVERKQSPWVVN
jgi:Zn finger protein HypA/HybF involved in hydrogenase expression